MQSNLLPAANKDRLFLKWEKQQLN